MVMKMKKIVSIVLAMLLLISVFAGCKDSTDNTTGKKKSKRELYSKIDLADYVEVNDYLGIEIDTASKEYIELYTYYLYSDIYNYKLADDQIKEKVTFDTSAETTVELGDLVNIDYTGYKGETAFEGGTAQGDILAIGSGTFIDDFEEQLIGVKVGQTVDVNVTFPSDYSSTELAGADAKFVVKVNGVAKEPEEIFGLLELDSKDEYVHALNTRAQKSFMFNAVVAKSKVDYYPQKDVEKFYTAAVEYYQTVYGADITQSEKDDVLRDLIYPTMKENMVMYYIMDKENIEVSESTIESQGVENAVIAESYAVNETVIRYLLDSAVIK